MNRVRVQGFQSSVRVRVFENRVFRTGSGSGFLKKGFSKQGQGKSLSDRFFKKGSGFFCTVRVLYGEKYDDYIADPTDSWNDFKIEFPTLSKLWRTYALHSANSATVKKAFLIA